MESKGQVLEEVVIPLPRPRSKKYGEWPTPSRQPCGTSQAKEKDDCWRSRTNQPSHEAIPRPRPKIASFVAPLPRPHGTSKYHSQLGYWRRCAIQAKKAANLAQEVAKKQANLANKVANLERVLVQAQVEVQTQVAAAMSAISQGLLQRVHAGVVLSAAVKGALARRAVTERKEQEKKAEQAQVGAQVQVAAAVAAISQGLLQRVHGSAAAAAVLTAAVKGALARRDVMERKVQEKKVDEDIKAAIMAYGAFEECAWWEELGSDAPDTWCGGGWDNETTQEYMERDDRLTQEYLKKLGFCKGGVVS